MNDSDYHQSIKKPKSSILIIWIIPFIALIIAGSLIAKHFIDQGEEIVIVFKSADGFTIGKTPLNYKGIKVGIVSDIKINTNNSREFLVSVRVDNSTVPLIEKKGTKFWKVEPKVSLGEVSGLNTIISGSYIEMLPGRGSVRALSKKDIFEAETIKPIASYQDGFFIFLKSDSGELSLSAPLLYKNYAVGKVVKKELKNGRFWYTVFVENQYGQLIKEKSHFWNVSGVEIEAALTGLKVNFASLASIVSGGVMFDSPSGSKSIKDKRHVFNLCQEKDDIHVQGKGATFTVRADQLGSLNEGDPLFYKRVKAGEVRSLGYDVKKDVITLKIFVKEQFLPLVNQSTRFYRQSGISFELNSNGLLFKTDAVDTVLRGGLAFRTQNVNALKASKSYVFNLYENELLANETNVFVDLFMDRGHKLSKGSQVLYKDLKVGYVESLQFADAKKVKVRLAIDQKHRKLLVKDTIFWLEDLEATVRGVKNSRAAIFGPSLCLQPGQSLEDSKTFTLSHQKPFETYSREGLRVLIKGSRKSSMKAGAPVLYRQHKIGAIEHYDLAQDGTSVEITLFIEKKYAHMVRKNTRFYHLSAIGMKVNLTGIKVMTETLDSMIYGGIGMATPDDAQERATEGDTFILELEAEDDWYEWAPKLTS